MVAEQLVKRYAARSANRGFPVPKDKSLQVRGDADGLRLGFIPGGVIARDMTEVYRINDRGRDRREERGL